MQVVTLRLEATGAIEKPPLRPEAPQPAVEHDAAAARAGTREAWLDGGAVAVPLFDRARLAHGHRIAGPAIIEQMDSTTLLLPGWSARVDGMGNLVLERDAAP